MVGIIAYQQEQRQIKVSSIRVLLTKIIEGKESFTHREVVITVMNNFNLGKVTATDYIDMALNLMDLKRGDIFK